GATLAWLDLGRGFVLMATTATTATTTTTAAAMSTPVAAPLWTDEQRAFVEYAESGDLCLRGPPGTGKTTCLLARRALLQERHGWADDQVLLLTPEPATWDALWSAPPDHEVPPELQT